MTTTRPVPASSAMVRFFVLSRTTRISKTHTTKPRNPVRSRCSSTNRLMRVMAPLPSSMVATQESCREVQGLPGQSLSLLDSPKELAPTKEAGAKVTGYYHNGAAHTPRATRDDVPIHLWPKYAQDCPMPERHFPPPWSIEELEADVVPGGPAPFSFSFL